MSRIAPLEVADAGPQERAELDRQLAAHGRLTNMKRTLAHSGTALHALMTWYPLRDRVEAFLGERATTLFAHAISARTDCLICSTFFRRILVEWGEDPDALMIATNVFNNALRVDLDGYLEPYRRAAAP